MAATTSVLLPNGKLANFHGANGTGFVYVAGRRVYGSASWHTGPLSGGAYRHRFTPTARGKYAHLVQPIPDTAAELDSGPLSVN
jgi:hypothetical protein